MERLEQVRYYGAAVPVSLSPDFEQTDQSLSPKGARRRVARPRFPMYPQKGKPGEDNFQRAPPSQKTPHSLWQ